MSFQITPARSSRVTKSRKPSALAAFRRSSLTQSGGSPKRKASQGSTLKSDDGDDERLDDTGLIASLAADLNFRDVPQYMEYIRNRMFSEIPETGAGMNSGRISEVLNYRRNLPPIVTIAHVDTLSPSSTQTEREIVELAQAGILRRVTIPHRGSGSSAVGDGLALVSEWKRLLHACPDLTEDLKAKYIAVLDSFLTSPAITSTNFTPTEVTALTAAGFLTTSTAIDSRSTSFASLGSSSLGSLSSIASSGSRHASGSIGAVGGADAMTHIWGGGSGRNTSTIASYYNFSLPNTGTHIKLLIEARNHLLALLKKNKHKEFPMDVLRERWDGNTAALDEKSRAKRARGEFSGVLPGRTKKWKTFYGLRFEWILEECVGAGLVELFETGSVGKAVRA
ncbi:hypothetical protein P154DRAFT_525891, partial [Amniculicola lignicola CBS 123094]